VGEGEAVGKVFPKHNEGVLGISIGVGKAGEISSIISKDVIASAKLQS
jgi:hypothetical protein